MRVRVMLAAVLAAGGVAAGAAPAGAADPTWRAGSLAGWESLGALLPGRPAELAATGSTVAVIGTDGPLRIGDPGGGRAVRRPRSRFPGGIAYLGPRRLLAGAGCAVQRTDDDGATWARGVLPGCDHGDATYGPGPSLVVVDDRTALASYRDRTWRTSDAGETWAVTPARGDAPAVALTADVWFRVVVTGGPVYKDERSVVLRTTDAGRTWDRLALPDVLWPGGVRRPAEDGRATAALAVRPGGALVVGYGRTLLTSVDAGTTFAARDLPPNDTPAPPAIAGPEEPIERVLCDPAGSCVVGTGELGLGGGAGRGRVFDGEAFGPTVDGPPERAAVSPAPGVVVGLTYAGGDDYKSGPVTYRLVRSDDLGATPYRSAGEWYGGAVGMDGAGFVTGFGPGGDRVSGDGGERFGTAPPGVVRRVRLRGRPGRALALTATGALWRVVDGAWTLRNRVSGIGPATLVDAGDGGAFVVGTRGIRRLSAAGAIETVRHPAPGRLDRPPWAVDRGRTLLVGGLRDHGKGSGGFVLFRTTDGGRRWTRVPGPVAERLSESGSITFVDERVGYALRGDVVVRTTDAGRSFRRASVVPVLDTTKDDGTSDESAEVGTLDVTFSDRRTWLAQTTSGLLRTVDGGRRWMPVPAPLGLSAGAAVLRGDRLLLETPSAAGLWRTSLRSWQRTPSIALRLVRRLGPERARTVRVAGVVRSIPPRGHVVLTAVRADGTTTPLRGVAAVRGRFVATVRLPSGARGLRAWYLGSAEREATIPGAGSPLVRVP